ncbi:MAG: hypothetical protein ACXV2C_00360 [Candidatus Bathyarchaeia archaeon]
MKNLFLIGCLVLGGCAGTTDLIVRQNEVVKPSDAMYKCNIASMPDPANLTDLQVARLVEQMYYDNKQCRASLNAIHAFEDSSGNVVAPNVKPNEVRKLYKMYVK